jgi:hypothetical protein
MSGILVLASSHSPDPNASAGLRDTAEHFGVPLTILGEAKPLGYPSNDPRLFLESVPLTLAFLRAAEAPYIVQTDAFDVLCCRQWNAETIMRMIDRAPGNLIVSCEANCFPAGPWKASYDARSASPWRYPNAGQWCATRESAIQFLETLETRMRAVREPYNPFGGAAQEILHHLYGGSYPMALDRQCRIFQSMYLDSGQVLYNGLTRHSMDDDRRYRTPTNTVTFTCPYFLHFNGRQPGMGLWYRALLGKPMPDNPMRPEYAETL